jgi:hypothetical protein
VLRTETLARSLLLVALIAGCGGEGSSWPDARSDAGSDVRADARDGGPADAPAPHDATDASSPVDAGADATPLPDASSPDAGEAEDASVAQDADASRDAGPSDVADATRDAASGVDTGASQSSDARDAALESSDATDVRVSMDAVAETSPQPACTLPSVDAGAATLDNGRVCRADSQCVSGHCVEGICCNSACTGTCSSCWVGEQVGVCTPVTSTLDLDTCSGDRACNAQGACLARDGQSCSSAQDCAFGFCVSGKCCGTATCQPVREWQMDLSAYSVTASEDGSIYAMGFVYPTQPDLDPRHACVAYDPDQAAYLTKLDADGRYLWSHIILTRSGVSGGLFPRRMVVTPDGGVAIEGSLTGTVDFDPGPGVDAHSAHTANDESLFVTRYASDGTYRWTRTWDSDQIQAENGAIVPRGDGGFWIAGAYRTTVDFDPGAGTDMHSAAGGGYLYEGFLLSLAADGRYLGVTTWPSSKETFFSDISSGPNDELVISGTVSGEADLDPGSGIQMVSAPESDVPFVMLLDATGKFRWKRLFSGAYPSQTGVTSSGDVLLSGGFSGTVDFDPMGSHVTYTAKNFADTFVEKLSGADGRHLWTRQLATALQWSRFKVGPGGSAVLAGQAYQSSFDVDPGPGTVTVTFPPSLKYFVLQLSTSGDYLFHDAVPLLLTDMASTTAAPVVLAGDVINGGPVIRKYAR